MSELREGISAGVGAGESTEILLRRLPDRMVEGISQSASAGRIADGGVRVLRSTADGETAGENVLQPVLLSAGNGSDSCGGNM